METDGIGSASPYIERHSIKRSSTSSQGNTHALTVKRLRSYAHASEHRAAHRCSALESYAQFSECGAERGMLARAGTHGSVSDEWLHV